MKIKCILFLISTFLSLRSFSQSSIHPSSTKYVYPKEKEIAENLENWRDQKFGIIIHWGLYTVPGIIESWSLCDEDWINRDTASIYTEYKKWYWDLNETFNPTRFNPDAWAIMAKNAGMRYVVFTTKHHDGFNMFDTKFSDFKISNGPFKNNPKANVAKEVFSSFRKEGMLIGAYYSKPDWHSQYFWWDRHATPNRNVNYDIRKYPWRWSQFVQFTHNQIEELTTDYGKIDILWLDGGWVRPRNSVTEEVLSWGAPIPDFDQQIDIPKMASKARKNQPGMLIVDRTVHGEYENYRTPEQGIPAKMSSDPWESCITLGGAWSHVSNDPFKTSAWAIHTLIEVVSKGGNLLLGVGPNPQGEFLQIQEERLKEIGKWLDMYGEAIYNTRAIENFKDGEVYFTQGKKQFSYAIQRITEKTPLAENISWIGNAPKKGTVISILGQKDNLKWETKNGKTTVSLPKEIWPGLKNHAAVALKFEH